MACSFCFLLDSHSNGQLCLAGKINVKLRIPPDAYEIHAASEGGPAEIEKFARFAADQVSKPCKFLCCICLLCALFNPHEARAVPPFQLPHSFTRLEFVSSTRARLLARLAGRNAHDAVARSLVAAVAARNRGVRRVERARCRASGRRGQNQGWRHDQRGWLSIGVGRWFWRGEARSRRVERARQEGIVDIPPLAM
jgi:hypothetical protein